MGKQTLGGGTGYSPSWEEEAGKPFRFQNLYSGEIPGAKTL